MATIYNRTFESGTDQFQSWFNCTVTRITSDSHSGSASLECVATATSPGVTESNWPYTACPADTYLTFSVWIKRTAGTVGPIAFAFGFLNSSNATVGTEVSFTVTPSNEWRRATFTFKTHASAATVYTNISGNGATTSGGTWLLDDMVMETTVGPWLASSSRKNSINTTSDLVADAMTILRGDVVVVKAGTWSSSIPPTASAPSATGLTFTQRAAETGGSFNGNMYIWTAVAGSDLGSTVVTLPGPSTNCHHAMSVEIWRNGLLASSPVVATAFTNTAGAASVSITTTDANSVVTWGLYDTNAAAMGSRAYQNNGVEIGVVDGNAGSNGSFYWAFNMVASAGTTAYGLTAPNTRFNAAGIEILAEAPDDPLVAFNLGFFAAL